MSKYIADLKFQFDNLLCPLFERAINGNARAKAGIHVGYEYTS
jgi:hypothetical protein